MEASSVPASSPRVYMPINHTDSPAPAYAGLQLVGYSDPSPQSPNFAHVLTAARSSPSTNWGPGAAGDAREGNPLPAGLMDSMKANPAGNSGLYVGLPEAEGVSTHSPDSSSAGNPSPQSSSTGNFFCADNPSPRGSCMDSSTCSSLIKGFDKKAVSIKPSPMKKTGVAGPSAASVGMKKCSKVGSPISVSHTEKETIVHTHSSNFREVVHQLTGASRDDSDLLPVTIPSRAPANRGNGDDSSRCLSKQDPFVTCDFTGRSPEFGLRKPMPTKLFERRRSSKTLERISTSCRDLPPLVPSPVTPLASDFERICLPVTPVASPISVQVVPAQERSIVQMHSISALQQNGNVQMYSSYNQAAAMYMFPHSNQSQSSTENLYSVASEPHNVARIAQSQQEASIEDFVIAEKGFFLHPQRPRNSEPALLPLFPESPRDQ